MILDLGMGFILIFKITRLKTAHYLWDTTQKTARVWKDIDNILTWTEVKAFFKPWASMLSSLCYFLTLIHSAIDVIFDHLLTSALILPKLIRKGLKINKTLYKIACIQSSVIRTLSHNGSTARTFSIYTNKLIYNSLYIAKFLYIYLYV